MANVRKEFGARVRTFREARGLSQSELAAAVGLSANHLGVLERGATNPNLENIVALAKALNVHVAELLADDVPTADPWVRQVVTACAAIPASQRKLVLALLGAVGKHGRR